MLNILYKNPVGVIMRVTWSVGTPSPLKSAPQVAWTVGEVSASGQELEVIRLRFKNLPDVPTPESGEVTWYGDFAKFIAGNLP